MSIGGDGQRDLSRLVVPLRGSLELTGDVFEPWRLADGAGTVVGAAAAYLRELAASGRAAATQRSYAYDLLRSLRDLAGQVGREAGRVAVWHQWLRIFNMVRLR
jgi:hypothetical protein